MSAFAAMALPTRIEHALALRSREETIIGVKQAVIDELERVDSRVSVRSTDYFRHTYAPDLILKWGDQVDRAERWVYLRSKTSAGDLDRDLLTVGREQPIIFGLGGPPGRERVEEVRNRSLATGTLITDPKGLAELEASGDDSQIRELVSRTILRGGGGVYDQQLSGTMTQTISSGFAAAFQASPESTFAAAKMIRGNLGENSVTRLLRLLHAIWVGSGGRSDHFPDAPSAEGPLGDDALELLLDGPEIEDPAFWQRLASVSLPQLARLQISDRSRNLGGLLLAHADTIEGRWCRVRPDQPRTGDEQLLRWGIGGGAVALHGATFSAYLAQDKEGLGGVEPVRQRGISLETLAERAQAAVAEVSDVTATGGGLIVEVASESHGNVLENPNAPGTVGAASGNITRATATLANSRVVVGDFSILTASGRSNSTLTLRELVRHGIPLVWTLDDDEMMALADMLPAVDLIDQDPEQPTLFDDFEIVPQAVSAHTSPVGLETRRWSGSEVGDFMARLEVNRPMLAAVVQRAAQLCNFDSAHRLNRFTMPATGLARQMVEDGSLPNGLDDPIRAVYEGGGKAIGFGVPAEFVDFFAE